MKFNNRRSVGAGLFAATLLGLLAASGARLVRAQSFTVELPEVFAENQYLDDDPPAGNSVDIDLRIIPGIPRFDPAQGSLTRVEVSAQLNVSVTAFLDVNGILNTGSAHNATASGDVNFVIGFSPFGGNSISHVASDFVDWSIGCTGVPSDMDGCQDLSEEFFEAEVFGTVQSGQLAGFIGTGTVGDQAPPGSEFGNGALEVFITRPISANFVLGNLGGASVDLTSSITGGTVTVEYFANDGSSPDVPLLPGPMETLGPEFDDVDCVNSFCIPGTLPDSGPGIDEPLFFDPPAAIGFDYEVVMGPNIAGIQLPGGFGDDLFELLISTDAGATYEFFAEVEADEFLDLTGDFPGGVSHLRVQGIEPAAGVDPDDPVGFPTGLTFVSGNSQVGIVMTAIVPEPTAMLLMLSGLGLAIGARRRI